MGNKYKNIEIEDYESILELIGNDKERVFFRDEVNEDSSSSIMY